MTSASDPHEEFEIAALRRARGALDDEGVTRLDAHLATCAACRDFGAVAEATEQALRARGHAAVAKASPESVRSGLGALQRVRRTKALRDAAGITLLVPVVWWGIAWWFALWVVVSGVLSFALRGVRELDRRRRLQRSDEIDLLTQFRFDLDAEIARLRRMERYGPLLFGVCAVEAVRTACIALARLVNGRPIADSRFVLTELVIVLIAIAVIVWPQWRRSKSELPSLVRSREDLGE